MNIKKYWNISKKHQKVFIVIYILSFAVASATHLRDIISGGFLPYSRYPLWANIYWTSLTVMDPVSIVLLLICFRPGLFAYAAVIISDVIINLSFIIPQQGIRGVLNIYTIGQVFFLVFLLLTFGSMFNIAKKSHN